MKSIFEILFQEYKYWFSRNYLYIILVVLLDIILSCFFGQYEKQLNQLTELSILFILIFTKRTSFYSGLPLGAKEFFKIKSADNFTLSIFLTLLSELTKYAQFIFTNSTNVNSLPYWVEPLVTFLFCSQVLFGIDLLRTFSHTTILPVKVLNNKVQKIISIALASMILISPLFVFFKYVVYAWVYDLLYVLLYVELVLCSLPIIFFGVFSRRMSELPIRK